MLIVRWRQQLQVGVVNVKDIAESIILSVYHKPLQIYLSHFHLLLKLLFTSHWCPDFLDLTVSCLTTTCTNKFLSTIQIQLIYFHPYIKFMSKVSCSSTPYITSCACPYIPIPNSFLNYTMVPPSSVRTSLYPDYVDRNKRKMVHKCARGCCQPISR